MYGGMGESLGRLPAYMAVGAALCALPYGAWAGECASPGRDGSGPITGVVNAYWAGQSNPSAGATSFTLGAASGANTPIAQGDLLLIIQMQDSRINASDTSSYGDGNASTPGSGLVGNGASGRFEFVRATSAVPLSGGTLSVASPVQYNYTNAAATSTRGQRTFQIIRVPQYLDANVTGTVTAQPWDGSKGGVVVLDAANTLTLSGTIDVSGRGFRGGAGRASTTGSGSNTAYRTPFSNGANGAKGEGLAGTPRLVWTGSTRTDLGVNGYPNGDFARGAPGNAGGGGTDGYTPRNDENTGGGGGAGYGRGGKGGHAWCGAGPAIGACSQTGGEGGSGFAVQTVSRLVMGGGGGAGTTNNATGTPNNGRASSGAPGGGLVILRAGSLTGSGTINADGGTANQTVLNDGSGGGGGGGAVLLSAAQSPGLAISVSARGGGGGSNSQSSPHGPGGGGGGGYIGYTAGVSGISENVSGGAAGTTTNNGPLYPYGEEDGQTGRYTSVNATAIPGFSSGEECRVDLSKAFAPDTLEAGETSRLTLTLSNPNPTLPMSALTVTDPLPGDVVVAPTPNTATTCGGTVTAATGASSVSLSGGALNPQASCTVAVDVVPASGGTFLNTIAPGGAGASINGTDVVNTLAAEDTLSVTEPLQASKSVAMVGPANSTYAIPGELVEYTISFTNPAASAGPVNNIVLVDTLPAELEFVSADLAGAGSGPSVFDDGSPSTTLSPVFSYSNDGGATFGYTPTGTTDPSVTHVRFEPTGSMASGTTGSIRFRMRIP